MVRSSVFRTRGLTVSWTIGYLAVIYWISIPFAFATAKVRTDGPWFVETAHASRPFAPTAVDLNGDGWHEGLGFENVEGVIKPRELEGSCVPGLFAKGRAHRDNRVADLDEDASLELISNTYSNFDDHSSVSLFCEQTASFTFEKNPTKLGGGFGGWGETISVFDFDNDDDLDIFIPYYTSPNSQFLVDRGYTSFSPTNYFLRNDDGELTNITLEVGVGMPMQPHPLRVEGTDVADLNGDTYLDFYAASHLFINVEGKKFRDARAEMGLPEYFDEGSRFADLDNDGDMDLVLNNPSPGQAVAVFYRNGDLFDPPFHLGIESPTGYGLNVVDVNFDGWLDIVLPDNTNKCHTRFYVNEGRRQFTRRDYFAKALCGDLISHFDFNRDGKPDLLYRVGTTRVFENRMPGMSSAFSVVALGKNGERNQHGRMITAKAQGYKETLSRIIDAGRGFMAQSPYEVLFTSPYRSKHTVTVHFSSGLKRFDILPGQKVTIREGGEPTYDAY